MSAKEESSPLGRCSNPIEEDASSSIPMVDADADADADPALVIESEEDEGGDKRSSSDSSSLIPSLFSDLGMTSGFSSGAASCSSFFGCGGGGGLQDLQGLPGVVPGVVPGALGDRMRKQLRINQEEESAETEEEEEKGGIIAQVLELQKTLEDLTSRVDVIKEENLKLRAENCVLGQYIENLMQASSVFQPVGSGRSGSSGGSGGSSRPNGPNGPNGQREETIGAVIRSCARVKQQQEGRGSGSEDSNEAF